MSLTIKDGERVQRKEFLTVAEWTESGSSAPKRCILGKRVEDSSVEFNADVEETTDILGINYADVNKTAPSQTFDPAYIIGGDELMAYLYKAALTNDIQAYNGKFTIYLVAAFDKETDGGYYAVKHSGCSLIPSSLGGSAYLAMPFDVKFSNDITTGTIDKLGDDFAFTAAE